MWSEMDTDFRRDRRRHILVPWNQHCSWPEKLAMMLKMPMIRSRNMYQQGRIAGTNRYLLVKKSLFSEGITTLGSHSQILKNLLLSAEKP